MFRPPLRYLLPAASGLLLVAAFPPWNQAWLIWVALIPALLGLLLEPVSKDWKRDLAPGYLMGLLYFGGTLWWIGYVTFAGTALLILYIALYPAFWFLMARRLWPMEPPYTSIGNLRLGAELASWWVACEWLRGTLFSGFGWDGLGVALWRNLPLLQGARLGGVLFLTWLIVFVNVIGALTLVRFRHEIARTQKMRPHFDFGIALFAVALLFAWGVRQIWPDRAGTEAPRTLRFALVQPNIPQSETNPFPGGESLRRHLELTETAALANPQLVIWPEAPVAVAALVDPGYANALSALTARADYSLLMGSLDFVKGHYFNAAFLFPPRQGDLQVYAKNRLVPFGEYAPFADTIPLMRKLVPFDIDFTPGIAPRVLTMENKDGSGGIKLAPMICYEDTLGFYGRRVARLNPDVLVNITNDGWFKTSPGAAQHLANALFRAVELDRPLLRCGNSGVTAAIDQSGRIVSLLTVEGRSIGVTGFLVGGIAWYPAKTTPYLLYGDWILILPALALARYGVLWILRRKRVSSVERSPETPKPGSI